MESPDRRAKRPIRGGMFVAQGRYRPRTSPRTSRGVHLLSLPLDEHGTPFRTRRATPRADARRRELAADRRA
ncbi:hypothetical protein [Pseudonocardia sp. WMMC193]|uniref:hypothetical protein n=1 Tax=Pseudonocardia sp. WMMC193 TaxID=2911965 RepID=UPI001F15F022|nr:hypothetical protein [Pseudonocardia sp. WMMC193]MCF7551005.1 hypothetical protein [Pseudonocardia sp. WMMC193]